MVKIISSIIYLLNIIRKFLFKFECFLLKFLPLSLVTPTEDSRSNLYLLLNLSICLFPLMCISLPMKLSTTNPLSLSLDMMARFIHQKELSALIVVLLMNIFPTITAIKELKSDARFAKRLFLLKKAILSRLFENVLIVVISFL